MKIEELTVEIAHKLWIIYIDSLIYEGVNEMDQTQNNIANGLADFESMHFWLKHGDYQRAIYHANNFDSKIDDLRCYLEKINISEIK